MPDERGAAFHFLPALVLLTCAGSGLSLVFREICFHVGIACWDHYSMVGSVRLSTCRYDLSPDSGDRRSQALSWSRGPSSVFEDARELRSEVGYAMLDYIPDELEINSEVVMDEPISH